MSFFSRLFGSRATKELDPLEVVAKYGNVLETTPMNFGGGASVELLPYDKGTIQAAILEVSKYDGISSTMMESLEIGFVSLANFQENVASGSDRDAQRLLDRLRSDEDIESLSEDIAGFADATTGTNSLILKEAELLQAEWNTEVRSHA